MTLSSTAFELPLSEIESVRVSTEARIFCIPRLSTVARSSQVNMNSRIRAAMSAFSASMPSRTDFSTSGALKVSTSAIVFRRRLGSLAMGTSATASMRAFKSAAIAISVSKLGGTRCAMRLTTSSERSGVSSARISAESSGSMWATTSAATAGDSSARARAMLPADALSIDRNGRSWSRCSWIFSKTAAACALPSVCWSISKSSPSLRTRAPPGWLRLRRSSFCRRSMLAGSTCRLSIEPIASTTLTITCSSRCLMISAACSDSRLSRKAAARPAPVGSLAAI